MNRVLLYVLSLVLWCIILFLVLRAIFPEPAHAAPPVDPNQPRPDLFSCGTQTCDVFNPTTAKVKATHATAYRVVVEPGCSAGTIPADLEAANLEAQKVRLDLSRNDFAFDFTVHINCGSEQIRICGSVNVFCLGRNFPYNTDVDISDILSTYQPITRVSILLHEIVGHAVGSWNEQYALCAASCGFLPSPNWRDIMNTGPDSRHGLETIELGRWERTMYPLAADCSGPTDPSWGGTWNPCDQRWHGPDSYPWNFDPATNSWYDRDGISEWCCQAAYGGIYNRRLDAWYWSLPSVWSWSTRNPSWTCVTSCP